MSFEKPLVSIILPTFNRASVLGRAIRSVINQTYPAWELLIQDDGSTDDTFEIVRSFSADDSRIRYDYHENIGPSFSRNRGCEASRGSYLTFLDSDDEYLPDHLSLRIRHLMQHPTLDGLHGGIVLIGNEEDRFVPDAQDRSTLVPIQDCIVGGTFFLKKHVIERAGMWRDCYAEDYDLFLRLSEKFTIEKVDYPTYVYHRESVDSRCSTAKISNAS